MKANVTPGGFPLGHASGDANIWVYWCLWAHGGNIVDKNDDIILNSPETEQALQYAKQLYETMIQGVLSLGHIHSGRSARGRKGRSGILAAADGSVHCLNTAKQLVDRFSRDLLDARMLLRPFDQLRKRGSQEFTLTAERHLLERFTERQDMGSA